MSRMCRASLCGLVCLIVALFVTDARADPTTLDCPLRQLLLDFSQRLQPFRPLSTFQSIADALNGAPESNNCSVTPNPQPDHTSVVFPSLYSAASHLPQQSSALHVTVDCVVGSDDGHSHDLSSRPFRTLHAALEHIRRVRASSSDGLPPAVISLSSGIHHLRHTLHLTAQDSNLTILGLTNSSFLSVRYLPFHFVHTRTSRGLLILVIR
jgi:hypothetical protein